MIPTIRTAASWVVRVILAVLTAAFLGPMGLWPLAFLVPFLWVEWVTERRVSFDEELAEWLASGQP